MIRYWQDIGWKSVPKTEALRRLGGETRPVSAHGLTDKSVEMN
jgi:hypothetical protein